MITLSVIILSGVNCNINDKTFSGTYVVIQFGHINWMITLSVIILSGINYNYNDKTISGTFAVISILVSKPVLENCESAHHNQTR